MKFLKRLGYGKALSLAPLLLLGLLAKPLPADPNPAPTLIVVLQDGTILNGEKVALDHCLELQEKDGGLREIERPEIKSVFDTQGQSVALEAEKASELSPPSAPLSESEKTALALDSDAKYLVIPGILGVAVGGVYYLGQGDNSFSPVLIGLGIGAILSGLVLESYAIHDRSKKTALLNWEGEKLAWGIPDLGLSPLSHGVELNAHLLRF